MEPINSDFEMAIRKDRFQAFFQPITNLQTGAITAIEARVRWETAEHGLLTARDVLSCAAEADSQDKLDFRVLGQAAYAIRELKDSLAPAVRIAVNISAATCCAPGFTDEIKNFFKSENLPIRQFRLEFPEDAFIRQPKVMNTVVYQLSESGFEIAADHINNPETVASYLAAIPVNMIKLGEGLVGELPVKPKAVSQTKAILTAANKVDLQTAAEGIARLEQLEFLRQAGCHEGQGPLISKPRPIGEIMFLIKRGSCW